MTKEELVALIEDVHGNWQLRLLEMLAFDEVLTEWMVIFSEGGMDTMKAQFMAVVVHESTKRKLAAKEEQPV